MLGPASFFVSKTQRWAVSNVGLFTGSNSNQYIATSVTRFANTSDSELFQSARLSASSLRYFGLGLENGGYSVTVQFGEIQIQGSNTWGSLGRRLFDIYVQVSTTFIELPPIFLPTLSSSCLWINYFVFAKLHDYYIVISSKKNMKICMW